MVGGKELCNLKKIMAIENHFVFYLNVYSINIGGNLELERI